VETMDLKRGSTVQKIFETVVEGGRIRRPGVRCILDIAGSERVQEFLYFLLSATCLPPYSIPPYGDSPQSKLVR
jgi:hypothetical protein